MEKLTFEESIKELEQLVKDLEGTELTLDESIEKFEKGMKLSKHCSKLLESAEKKITLLIEKEDGSVETEDFKLPEEHDHECHDPNCDCHHDH